MDRVISTLPLRILIQRLGVWPGRGASFFRLWWRMPLECRRELCYTSTQRRSSERLVIIRTGWRERRGFRDCGVPCVRFPSGHTSRLRRTTAGDAAFWRAGRWKAKGNEMAQLDIPIAQKKCATCRWWSGARKLIFVGADPKFVRIGGVLPAVNCRAWDGRKFGGASTCFRWSKWEKL